MTVSLIDEAEGGNETGDEVAFAIKAFSEPDVTAIFLDAEVGVVEGVTAAGATVAWFCSKVSAV